MLSFLSKYKPIIGLDIGTTAIRAIEIRPSGSSWRLHRWGNQPLPPDVVVDGKIKNSEEVVLALQTLIAKVGFTTKRVALSVGGPSVVVKNIQLPVMSEMDTEDQISLEAEEHIPFGIDDVHLDFQILNQDQENMNVLLTACKKESLDDYIKIIQEAGLETAVCDLEICCLVNAHDAFISPGIFTPNKKKKKAKKKSADMPEKKVAPAVVLLANSGESYLNVVILIDGVPTFTRDYNLGTKQLIKQVADELEIPFNEAEKLLKGTEIPEQKEVLEQNIQQFEEQLTSTIQQSIDFFGKSNPGHEVSELALSGAATQIPGIEQRLSEKLTIQVVCSNPITGLKPGSGKGFVPMPKDMASRFIIALGLALRGDM
ncbi:MAG: type IV pilus assembly protein PilM [Magnetococcales bacterium]|nr:type IV pilus assembly protein PilM [Magnetococcales bacterium]